MTDDQFEIAARKLCKLRGIDPDKSVPHGAPPNDGGYVPAVLLHSPAWKLCESEIRGFWQLAEAVDFAMGGKGIE